MLKKIGQIVFVVLASPVVLLGIILTILFMMVFVPLGAALIAIGLKLGVDVHGTENKINDIKGILLNKRL